MKIDRLETHDRFLHFKKQGEDISWQVIDCINNVPDEVTSPFYVFGHLRTLTIDEQIKYISQGKGSIDNPPTHKLVWQPRISKPKSQTNSYLFLAKKGSDTIKVIWKIPPREVWDQYSPGKMTHDLDTWISIENFQYHREQLDAKDEEGPTLHDEELFRRIIVNARKEKKMSKQASSVVSLDLFQGVSSP